MRRLAQMTPRWRKADKEEIYQHMKAELKRMDEGREAGAVKVSFRPAPGIVALEAKLKGQIV